MARFRIDNLTSGVSLGVYEGDTPAEALEALARDAGYSSYFEACEAAPVNDGEILITEEK